MTLYNDLASLATLTFLEIILGVDNLVFVAILSERAPKHQQKLARRLGLIFALLTRLVLLSFAVSLARLTQPFVSFFHFNLSVSDFIFLGGGLFLLAKATSEIHDSIEGNHARPANQPPSLLWWVVIQIGLLDIIFSLDSVITAIGIASNFFIMATAIMIAILTMIFAAEPLTRLIKNWPTLKMLALSFLVLIGAMLVADGLHFHIPRAYIYFAIAFSVGVEVLNHWVRKKR